MNKSADTIESVWNVSIRSSNGMIASSYDRHPEQAQIQQNKQIVLENIGLKFNIPQLPFLKDTTVKLDLNDKSRGVTDHYIFLLGENFNMPCAAIVITELPTAMQNLNDSLNAAVDMQRDMAQKAGVEIEFSQAKDDKFGIYLQTIIPHRKGTIMFPTSNYTIKDDQKNLTIGLSRFAFFNNKLIEWSLIIPITDEIVDDQIMQYCVNIMNDFWINLELL